MIPKHGPEMLPVILSNQYNQILWWEHEALTFPDIWSLSFPQTLTLQAFLKENDWLIAGLNSNPEPFNYWSFQ